MTRSSLNMALLVSAVLVAALVQNSAAQTSHVVGDSAGWTIQSYAAWAANQTFTVGDSCVFNFVTGNHDVAQVIKADYDACSASTPILAVTTGPATIKLNSSGEHYFICRYTGHCSAGQKLAINVSAAATPSPSPQASSPAPQTSTPPSVAPAMSPASTPSASPASPVSAPAPSPSGSTAETYVVGDTKGWSVPTAFGGNTSFYQTWAANKSFKVGDKLVFNYAVERHNVAEVSKAAYNSCDTKTTISVFNAPPTTVTLNSSGEHFFICLYTGHCANGQKLEINVTGSTASPTPSPTGSPSSSTTPSTPSPSSGSSSSPPPAGNSASSLGVAGVSAAFLSIFIAFVLG